MAPRRDLVRRTGRSRLRQKKGVIEQLYTAPPTGSVVVCLDEMGPQAARSFPGQHLVKPAAPKAERAKQEIDYGGDRLWRRSTMADAMPPAMCSGRSSRPAAQPLPTPMIAAPQPTG